MLAAMWIKIFHMAANNDMSSMLYCSRVPSSYKLVRYFTKPLTKSLARLPEDLFKAHGLLHNEKKQTLVLRFRLPKHGSISPGDMVELHVE